MTNRRHRVLGALTVLTAAFRGGDARAQEVDPVPAAERLLEQGDAARAEEVLRAASRSGDAAASRRLAVLLCDQAVELQGASDLAVHLATGLVHEALSLYEHLLEADAADRDALEGAVWCDEFLGQGDAARRRLEAALAAARGAVVLEMYVDACLRAGDPEAAEQALEETRREVELPTTDFLRIALKVAAARKDGPGVDRLAEELARQGGDPWVAGYLLWEGHSGETLDFEALLHAYSVLAGIAPDEPVYRYYRGATRVLAGDPAGGELDLRACAGSPELGPRVSYYLARALLAQGKPEEAERRLEEVVAAGSWFYREAISGLVDVAVSLGRARRFADALRVYRRVLELEPENEWALLGVPLCYKGLGDLAAAEAAYGAALEILPYHPQLLNDRALLLLGAGRDAAAREGFERARDAGSVDAAENLAVLALHQDHDAERAAALFAQVLEAEPGRARSRFYREISLESSRP